MINDINLIRHKQTTIFFFFSFYNLRRIIPREIFIDDKRPLHFA